MQSDYNTRLQRKYEKNSKQRAYLLLVVSIVLVIALIYFGIPLLFNFATTISNMRNKGNPPPPPATQIAPTVPQFAQDLTATKSAQITLHGASDPNTTIEIYQNSNLSGTTTASADGTFSFDVILNSGSNDFQALAVGLNGQKSAKSDIYTIVYSSKEPKLDINSPHDGDTVNQSPVSVSGKTDAGDSVSVNDHMAITGNDGSFNYNLSLSSGDNKVKVVATDPAGNQTAKQFTIKYSPQ